MDLQNILDESKNAIVDILNTKLHSILVYGSYARNQQDSESDLDILVLADLSKLDIKEIENRLTKSSINLSLNHNIVFSFLLKDYKQFNKYLNFIPFYQNIKKEGMLIYGRGIN